MDLNEVMPWLGAIALIVSLVNSFHSFFTSGTKENAKRLEAIDGPDGKVTKLESRVQAVENELKHLPDVQTVNDIKLAIAELRGTMGQQAEVMNGVARTVHRLENYLLEKGK
ncbi:DUF2730 family protein [Nitratireductor mangrovi]|uniref:DUF2730 family protein n=1 Tax=Nitratireductor mangrovi TaxID=2599600 RepID=A0A5B8KU49_9HYPH|nr:DUF2730 family protein [Nitratireductor mangrovi]QDY99077.2 DUF2730 family protein [Nitratireductor mangrovi]